MKRIFDVLASVIALLLLSPLIIVVSILILFSMGRPIFFVQKRIGLDEKTIRLYKFRSMTNQTDDLGNLLPNHKRVTKVGRFIRKTSLDELPSLFNVVKGELSVVGPRPLLVKYLPFYKERHRLRHSVRPGITGLAQVNGRNSTTWTKRLNFDVEYVENQSMYLDLKIILLTVYKVFKREGVEGSNDLSIIPLNKDKSYLEGNND